MAHFFVMDRRGSGVSSGDRYKFPPANQIIDDYVTFFCKTFEQAEERPVIAVGHCLGGSVLAATLSSNPEYLTRFRNIYFASAWLGKMHTTIPEIGIEEIRKSETSEIWDAGLRAEDFSENSYYQDFIRNDEFAIRGLASSTRKNILELEDIYLQSDELSAIEASFITSHDDPVIDVESAVENFCSIFPNYGAIHFLNANRHYLPLRMRDMRSSGSSSRELKMLDSVSISKINLPMKVSFSHASSSRKASDSIILKIRKGDVIGYGECSPRKYVSAEDVDSVFEELLQWLKRYQTEILRLFRQIPQETGLYTAILPLMEDLGNNARCAVELCIRDMAEKICGSMLRTTVTTIHPFVPVCDSLGRWSVPESSLAEARLVKIKVGADIRKIFSEIERVKLLSDAEILVDANNSWSKSNAQDAVGRASRERGFMV